MGVPREAPAAVHAHWANVPNCAEIYLLFKTGWFGRIVRVKCEGWGQLANDGAATGQAMYHIRNKRPYWDSQYVGWEEIGGSRRGDAPTDFAERYHKYWKALGY
jgi:hypothetical protein